jgi:hypothetical protein
MYRSSWTHNSLHVQLNPNIYSFVLTWTVLIYMQCIATTTLFYSLLCTPNLQHCTRAESTHNRLLLKVYTTEFCVNTFKLHRTTNICTIYMSRVPKGVYRRPKVILSIPTWVGCATHINQPLGHQSHTQSWVILSTLGKPSIPPNETRCTFASQPSLRGRQFNGCSH